MKRGRVLSCLFAGLLALALPATVSAVTPEELVELSKAGLGEEVLLALIDTSGIPVVVDAAEALRLRKAGLSNRVIAAAVRAAAPVLPEAMPAAVAPEPYADQEAQVGVIGYREPAPPVIEREVYYVPWIVPVRAGHGRPQRPREPAPYLAGDRGFGRFINDGSRDRNR